MFKSLSGRLAVSYFAFFALSSVLIFGVLFLAIAKYLEQKDHDVVLVRFQQFEKVFQSEGVQGLQHIDDNFELREQASQLVIAVMDSDQKILFLRRSPKLEKISFDSMEKAFKTHQAKKSGSWFYVGSIDGDEDALDVWSVKLDSGATMFVGGSTDSRDDIKERILEIFILLLTPLLIIAAVGAFVISKKALRPVRELVRTVTNIKEGDLSSRVPIRESHDELHELSSLFNEMIERVEGLVTAMKDTLDNVAHDLKTPITRMKIAGELALRSKDNDQARTALSEVIENSDDILSLVKSIMLVSELNTKAGYLNRTVFPLDTLINEILDIYFFVAEEKSIKINFVNDEGLMVSADRPLLKQAIANLLDNALKYSMAGSEVTIKVFAGGNEFVIEVRDQGLGISEQDLPRIWERLYRGDKSRSQPGLGLGLSMVRAIVDAHNGHIQVHSVEGQGSTFQIYLPQTP